MRIAKTLVQHYFLEVDPAQASEVAAKLRETASENDPLLGSWRLFTWIDRPALWALRPVGRTVGLDEFLFDNEGLPGVVDVAEVISFPIEPEEKAGTLLAGTWEEFSAGFTDSGILFATFLHPDWDTLRAAEAWGDDSARPPSRSRILDGIRSRLERSLEKLVIGPDSSPPRLLLVASAGDADLILYGSAQSLRDLDECLYAATEMSIKCLAAEIGLEGEVGQWPVFARSHTELAVDFEVYRNLRGALAAGESMKAAAQRVAHVCHGSVSAELGLSRGRGALSRLKDRLTILAGEDWVERAILGGEDVVLASRNPVSFDSLLCLQARLDEELTADPGFMRRSSLRLGLEAA